MYISCIAKLQHDMTVAQHVFNSLEHIGTFSQSISSCKTFRWMYCFWCSGQCAKAARRETDGLLPGAMCPGILAMENHMWNPTLTLRLDWTSGAPFQTYTKMSAANCPIIWRNTKQYSPTVLLREWRSHLVAFAQFVQKTTTCHFKRPVAFLSQGLTDSPFVSASVWPFIFAIHSLSKCSTKNMQNLSPYDGGSNMSSKTMAARLRCLQRHSQLCRP